MQKNINRVISFVLAFVIAFSLILPGVTEEVKASSISEVVTFKISVNYHYVKDKYRAGGKVYWADGKVAYCCEPGIEHASSTVYEQLGSEIPYDFVVRDLSYPKVKAIEVAAMYGYSGSDTSYSSIASAVATQIIIWEIAAGDRSPYSPYSSYTNAWYNSIGSTWREGGEWGATNVSSSDIKSAYRRIENAMAAYSPTSANVTAPNFPNSTITLNWDASENAYVGYATDSNSAIGDGSFYISGSQGLSLTRTGNTIKIKATDRFTGTKAVSASKTVVSALAQKFKFYVPWDGQRLISYEGSGDKEVKVSDRFNVQCGAVPYETPKTGNVSRSQPWSFDNNIKVSVHKTNSLNQPIAGVKFKVTRDGANEQIITTDSQGNASCNFRNTDSGTAYSDTKYYVTNYDKLSPSDKNIYSGYYKSSSTAATEAQNQANARAATAKQNAKNVSHTYTVEEISVPAGYVLDSQKQSQTANNNSSLTLSFNKVNYEKPITANVSANGSYEDNVHVNAKILKVDKATEEPLEGFTFDLYEDGKKIGELVTGPDGTVSKGFDYPVKKTATATASYIVNYDKLSAADQAKYSNWHKTESAAKAAAQAEANRLAKAAASNDLMQKHTYKIVETKVNGEYIVDSTPVEGQSTGNATVVLEQKNSPAMGTISVKKIGPALTSVSDGTENVYKVFNYTDNVYAGAKFEIYADEDIHRTPKTIAYNKGDLVATIETGSDGTVVSPKLYLGKYKVVEIKAPTNLVLDKNEENRNHFVELIYKDQNTPIVVTNTQYKNERPSIEVTIDKTDAGDKTPLANAEFTLYANEDILDVNGNKILDKGTAIEKVVTDEAGKAKFTSNLPQSYNFKLVETKAPNGYSIFQEPNEFTTTYTDDKTFNYTYHYDIKDTPQVAKISIKKTGDAIDRATMTDDHFNHFNINYKTVNLFGAEFEIYAREDIYSGPSTLAYHNGDLVETIVSSYNGANSKFLPLGKYKVVETKAPLGYVLPEKAEDRTWNVDLIYKGQDIPIYTYKMDVKNELAQVKVKAIKLSAKDNTPIKGAEFTLFAGEQINKPIDGKSLFNKDDAIQTVVSDENGVAEFTVNLPVNQKYYVKETKAPQNYVLSDEVYNFTTTYKDDKTPVYTFESEFKNEEQKGQIIVKKYDKEIYQTTGKDIPQGDAVLNGAVYGLYAREDIVDPNNPTKVFYKKGTEITKGTVNETGDLIFKDLHLGKYMVKELTASNGYLIDPTEYAVDVFYTNGADKVATGVVTPAFGKNTIVTSLEQVKKGAFTFNKVSFEPGHENEKVPVANAEFTVKLKSDVEKNTWKDALVYDKFTTNDKGVGTSTRLPYGTYIVRETRVPHNLLPIEDFEVVIDDELTEPKFVGEFNDQPFKAYIRLHKLDQTSNKPVLLKNTTFKIFDIERNEYVSYTVENQKYDTFKTDENGVATTPVAIRHGKYRLEEIKAPNGYLINNKAVEFTVNDYAAKRGDGENSNKFYIDVNFGNIPAMGIIKVYKEGEVFVGASTVNKNDKYSTDFEYDVKRLPGAEFEIYAKEDILSADNQNRVIYSADEKIQTVTTGPDGVASSQKLPFGKYYVREIKAPDGYLAPSANDKEVVLSYANQETSVVVNSATFNNDRQKIHINILKLGKIKGEPDDTAEKLAGGEFVLYAAEDLKNNRGVVVIKKDAAIETQVSKEDGTLTFASDLPYGKYYILETKAPDGYVSSKERIDVDFNFNGAEVPYQEKTFKVMNTTTVVTPQKIDNITSVKLEGATLEVHPANAEGQIDNSIVIDRWVSKKGEKHSIKGLVNGQKYFIKEVDAPHGYFNGGLITFVPKDVDGEQIIEVTNEQVKGHVSIMKTGERLVGAKQTENGIQFIYDRIPLEGVKFKLYAAEDILNLDGESEDFYAAGDLVEEIVSKSDGVAVSKLLPIGKYYFQEIETADGLVKYKGHYPVEITYLDQNTPITITDVNLLNHKQEVRINILKNDAETKEPVVNAEFKIYNKEDIKDYQGNVILKANTLLDTALSDYEGKVNFDVDLPLGKYIIEESKPAPGYASNGEAENRFEVEAKYTGSEHSFVEVPAKITDQKIKHIFSKVDAATDVRLSGANLSVLHVLKDERGNLMKDEHGNYVTELVEAWTSDANEKITFNGNEYYGHLLDGKLTVGETYIYREVQAPDGYVGYDASSKENKEANKEENKITEEVMFTVTDNKDMNEHVIKDEAVKGEIIVQKSGEVLTDYKEPNIVKKALSAINRAFEYVTGSIKDVEFKVYANEDIKHPDGVSPDIYKKGDLVATITTNYLGVAKVENLPLGKYLVKESVAGDGFVLNTNEVEISLEYAGQDTPVVSGPTHFVNERQKVDVTIIKKSSVEAENKYLNTGDKAKTEDVLLAGATFGLYAKEDIFASVVNEDSSVTKSDHLLINKDQLIETKTTAEDGIAHFTSDLPLGKYYVKEIVPPTGYHLSDEIFEIDATYKDQNAKVLTFEHVYYDVPVSIEILKVSKEKNEPLSGATLAVLDENGHIVEKWVTDGTPHYVKGLDINKTYTLEELMPPLGYASFDPITFTVENMDENGNILSVQHISNTTDELIEIDFSKKDITSKEEIPGAHMQVLSLEGKVLADWISTDKEHKVRGLPIGEYILREVSAPTDLGYVKAEDVKFKVIDETTVQKAEMIDDYTKIEISKTDITTGKPVKGATLSIIPVDEKGNLAEKPYTTWVTGKEAHYLEYIPVGNYILREELPPYEDGYVKAQDVPFEVKETGEIQKVEMVDDYTKIEISKTDITNSNELPGAKLEIRDSNDKVVEKWTSTEEAHYIERLPVGDYTLIETSTPDGYVTATEIKFTVKDTGEIQKVEMVDDITKINISKTDITTGEELPGAKLEIRNKWNKVIEEWTSTDKPHYIEKLPVGKYKLVETFTPDGFVTSHDIEFTVEDTGEIQKVEMVDDITKINISKTDITTGEELPGATLQIIDKDNKLIEEWVSTDKPHYIEKLPVGDYTLIETIAPDGYVTSHDVKFTVKDTGEIQKVEMVDDITKINISKTDITTGEELPGATLELYNHEGKLIEKWVSSTEPHMIEKLPFGEYTLKEVIAPDGYVTAEEITFIVADTGEIQKVEMKDDYTKIEISKTDITTGEELPGAKLEIRDENDNLIKEWTSTDKPHYFEKIPVGKYFLVEIMAPDGYVTAERVPFEITDSGEIHKVEMKDDYTKIDISKTDITTGEELPGAKLEILDSNRKLVEEWTSTDKPHHIDRLPKGDYFLVETTAPDGYATAEEVKFTVEETGEIQKVEMVDDYTKIDISKTDITTGEELPGAKLEIRDSNNNIVEEWVSTDKPHYIEKLPKGDYTLTEITAPDGYVTAEKIEFTVEDTGEIQKVEMKDDYTKIEISKTDITNGKELPGAKLEIRDSEGNLIEEWTSTDKPHYIEKLPKGDYTLTEITAPDGYVTAEKIEFTVEDTGEIQKVEMKDDVIKLEVVKIDATTKKILPGAKLQILNTKGEVMYEWISTKKPALIEKIPAGDYILKEVSAPKDYKLADDIKFTVKDTDQVQKISMADELIDIVPTGDYNESTNYSIVILGICVVTALAYIAISKKKKMNK